MLSISHSIPVPGHSPYSSREHIAADDSACEVKLHQTWEALTTFSHVFMSFYYGGWHTCLLARSKYIKQAQDWRFTMEPGWEGHFPGVPITPWPGTVQGPILKITNEGNSSRNEKVRRDSLKRYSKGAKTSKNLETMGNDRKREVEGEIFKSWDFKLFSF